MVKGGGEKKDNDMGRGGNKKFRESIEGVERMDNWYYLKERIQQAIQWKEIEIGNDGRNEKWFDEKCRKVEKIKEYKEIIKRKREEMCERWLREVEEDKSIQNFGWK